MLINELILLNNYKWDTKSEKLYLEFYKLYNVDYETRTYDSFIRSIIEDGISSIRNLKRVFTEKRGKDRNYKARYMDLNLTSVIENCGDGEQRVGYTLYTSNDGKSSLSIADRNKVVRLVELYYLEHYINGVSTYYDRQWHKYRNLDYRNHMFYSDLIQASNSLSAVQKAGRVDGCVKIHKICINCVDDIGTKAELMG